MAAPASALKPKLFSLAWPIFVEQGLRVLIGTVDTLMVSHLGDAAVAGVGVASYVFTLFIILFAFVGIGSSVVITQYLGGHDRASADQISTTAIAANTWIGVLASALVLALAEPMLRLMEIDGAPLAYAKPFLLLMGGTLFLEAMNGAIAATLRAHTHTRDAMWVTAGQNVVNVIGNCLLLFGLCGFPKLGVVGVGISGIVSRLAASVALWIILEWRTHLKVRTRDFFNIQRAKLGRILHIGLPAAGEHTSWWLAFMMITRFCAEMGGSALATQQYVMNIIRWVVLLNVSIGLGTEILTGYLIGAGQFDEAYRGLLRSVKLGMMCALGGAIVLALGAPWLLGAFTNDPSIIAVGVLLLRIGLVIEPGRVFNVIVINSLRATGDARFPVFVGLCVMWGVWVPLSWFLGLKLGWGMAGIWCAMACDEWTRGLLMYWRWRKWKWLPYAKRSRAMAQEKAFGEAHTAGMAGGAV
ncbi:MAG TPA: MATE family efflux transporter [Opitutaceae bacterium]|nr:MATE family efflux transporter [Opitutaceae bacterium]